jgi:transcriptional/translational regulatory protein YebC/TACO1
VTEEGQEALERFIDTMEEDEDVTNVFHNAKIVEEEEMGREERS